MRAEGNSSLTISAKEFFHEMVQSAMNKQQVKLNSDIQFYLVNLLCDFIEPHKMMSEQKNQNNGFLHTPLAMLYKEAHEAESNEKKLKILKHLGDTSLYVSGFFQDYFNRKTFDIEYFITMGKNAYANVSIIFKEKSHDDHFSTLYAHLANNFPTLVEVVADISDTNAINQPSNILAIYDRWTKTNSSRLRKVLEDSGISPIQTNTRKAQ